MEEKKTMHDYIVEAPSVCRNNIENYKELVKPLIDVVGNTKIKTIWLVASGSSFNSCNCARMFMKSCLDCEVKVITPFNFTYYEFDVQEEDLVMVVSQSGLSTNAIEALKKLKQMNCYSIALSGNPENDIKDYADLVVDYGVGEELVGYVTKGVTTLCLFLMLFAIEKSGKIKWLKELEKAIDLNEEMIKKAKPFIKKHYKKFSGMNHIYFCGAGSHYGTALEGSLKIGETIHIPSCFYEIEEYIHGPNLQLTPDYTVILFDGNDAASERVKQVYLASKEVSEKVFLLSNNPTFNTDENVICLSDKTDELVAPLVYLPFVQLLSHKISHDLGTTKQHPLLKNFKKIASAKTENFVNYDGDE